MAPSRIGSPIPILLEETTSPKRYSGPPRNIAAINNIQFDSSLQPKNYEILGTHPESKLLFLDVNILDSTGRDPYRGDVLIEGEKSVRCFGAASAKERLDVVIRDAINAGDIPGPRYLANGKEMARRDGTLVAGITAYADGPEEMREVIRHHVNIGVDQVKLSMSGEEITETKSAQDCYYTDDETAACVDEAHSLGARLCAHARARDSVKMCIRHGVDVIYHASYTDDEGMEMLDAKKDKHIVAPALNWLIATLNDAAAFGYTHEKAESVGYQKELDAAIRALREMHKRGIVVLPGGDYGFAWTPHGTYARDLAHFVNLLDFTPMESIIAATAGVAKLFMRDHELGKIQAGFYGDCILVDGNPLEDITILQDHDRLNVITINGRVHKAGRKEYVAPPIAGQDGNSHPIVPDFPELKASMQKNY
ncbi:amidohydrolase [Botrytis cinerea]